MTTVSRARRPRFLAAAAVSFLLSACATTTGASREWRYDAAAGEWGFHPVAAGVPGAASDTAAGQVAASPTTAAIATDPGADPAAAPSADATPAPSADATPAPSADATPPSVDATVDPTPGDGTTGGATGAGGSPAAAAVPAAATSARVTIIDDAFRPATVTVRVGGQVTWTNTGEDGHTVTFPNGASSEILVSGASFIRSFAAAGTYDYLCAIHSGMTGTVIVSDATRPAPGGTTPAAPGTTGGPTASPDATIGPGSAHEPTASPDDDGGGDDDRVDDDRDDDRDDGDRADGDDHSGHGHDGDDD